MKPVRFLPAGDSALSVEFGNEISEEINRRIRALNLVLREDPFPGLVEMVPTYRSLMIHYDPGLCRYDALVRKLQEIVGKLDQITLPPASVLEIPVLYGGEEGPDLNFVAEYCHMTPEEVVRIHTSADYLIYMLGFTPGFPYLGGMSEKIAAPRLEQPRLKIPAGSVGIAGAQTGIYPIDSPGGWQLIGRTPLRLYDPDRAEPVLCRAGDYIRFTAVTREEYLEISAQVADGAYECRRRPREEAAE